MDTTMDATTNAQIHDNDQFASQVLALEGNLYRLACSLLHHPAMAEDAVAEAVYRAYVSRYNLKDQAKFQSWLYKILVNQCKTMLKKQKLEGALLHTANISYVPPPDISLWDLITQLPKNQQCVITLYYYEGYSVKEIAKLLHLRESSVRARMSRGRNTLRHWLEESQ